MNKMTKQKTLFWNQKPLSMSILGEKPYKLMQLKQSGFPVPEFCTIVSDGSGEITLDKAVRKAFDKLTKPLIARSAHPMEGTGYSFSGVFESIGEVLKPKDLAEAYKEIVEFANPVGEMGANRRVKHYLDCNKITGFNPTDMNVLLMEQRNVQIFGMFMTSDQTRPDETVIHYEDRRNDKGGVVVYDKKAGVLKTKLEGDLDAILTEFGKLANRVEQKFGKPQQVEMGLSDKGVEVYQSREMNFGNSDSVPRFAHYKTFSADLHAEGYGYFHLPVLVIDSLENVEEEHSQSKEETIEKVIKPYKTEVKKFIEEHKEYIVVLKDGELFSSFYSGKTVEELWSLSHSKKEEYAELNEVTRRAKVMFKGTQQNAIRHEDWDNVEYGGIVIWMNQDEKMNNLFAHKTKLSKYKFPDYEEPVSPNLTLISSWRKIKTGDYLHVLSNSDGLFVWRD